MKMGHTVPPCVVIIGVSAVAYLFAENGHHYLAGFSLVLLAAFLFLLHCIQTRSMVNLPGLFLLSWIGGEGLACLQLSKLQADWNALTWICFCLAPVLFLLGNVCYNKWSELSKDKKQTRESLPEEQASARLKICIYILAVCSVICFGVEALVVGFVPLFSKMPHGYSYFHVSGVHYFTISSILIPAMTVIYMHIQKGKLWEAMKSPVLVVCNLVAFAIPVLCVSRFQLLFAVGFAVIIYILTNRNITWKQLLALMLVMLPAYVLLTVARHHNVSYLNSIFEMKNQNTPIFITQPYMYIANNYENFNCMVEQLPAHTWGLKMLFPVFALTGLKFVFPQWTTFPAYITRKELTTLTVFYDAYYDFGIVGVGMLAWMLGMVAGLLTEMVRKKENPVRYMFYGQVAVYFCLSFFTTWFSNPTTWFWLILTAMIYVFVGWEKPGQKRAGRTKTK